MKTIKNKIFMIYSYYLHTSHYIDLYYSLKDIIICGGDSAEYHPRHKKLKYYQKRK